MEELRCAFPALRETTVRFIFLPVVPEKKFETECA
jgi:hypothetical protein